MHWISLAVIIILFAGLIILENRKSVLSVFLPLICPAWAASILRFDFFIHRQAAYLRNLEVKIQESGFNFPLWENWKSEHTSGFLIVPLADLIIFLIIVISTAYILFTYTSEHFERKKWRFRKFYVWSILFITIALLSIIPFVPIITDR